MLFSFAIILLMGLLMGSICKKLHLPALVGMILTGIVLGPYALDLIDPSILGISSELRRMALIIILMRAGLSLNLADLKKVGRPAVLMCFVPACFEMAGMLLIAPKLLGISLIEAAVMGTVIAAVSPAVIVPGMLKLMEEGYGTKASIPQMILAAASVDDVFVIVFFSVCTGMAQNSVVSVWSLFRIPISIGLGAAVGAVLGIGLAKFFQRLHMRDTVKVIILLSIAFLLVTLEDIIGGMIPFSGLIAVMTSGIALKKKHEVATKRLSVKFNKLWVGAEIVLFVLVGATVDLHYAIGAGGKAVLLIFCVLLFRMLGVFVCLIGTRVLPKERLFCMIAYLPKATVQAAIGGIPLSMGLPCGKIVLTVAVLSILITAPLGAFLIDLTYKQLLEKEE